MEDKLERARAAEPDDSAKADKPAKAKKKPGPPRRAIPEQSPRRRVHSFEEVPKGYTPEVAMVEASRCLNCKKPMCVLGCPVNIDIASGAATVISAMGQGEIVAKSIDHYLRTGRLPPTRRRSQSGRSAAGKVAGDSRWWRVRDGQLIEASHVSSALLRGPAGRGSGLAETAREVVGSVRRRSPQKAPFNTPPGDRETVIIRENRSRTARRRPIDESSHREQCCSERRSGRCPRGTWY